MRLALYLKHEVRI